MPLFSTNTQRLTPYANYRFKVKWDNTYVLGVSRVSTLSPETRYSAITLERGVSYDVTFEQWANKAFDTNRSSGTVGQNTSLLDFRKDFALELYNEAGMKVAAYNVHRAWVSEFSGLPEVDGVGNALVVASITIQHEGWERDDTIKEPSLELPAKGPV